MVWPHTAGAAIPTPQPPPLTRSNNAKGGWVGVVDPTVIRSATKWAFEAGHCPRLLGQRSPPLSHPIRRRSRNDKESTWMVRRVVTTRAIEAGSIVISVCITCNLTWRNTRSGMGGGLGICIYSQFTPRYPDPAVSTTAGKQSWHETNCYSAETDGGHSPEFKSTDKTWRDFKSKNLTPQVPNTIPQVPNNSLPKLSHIANQH